MIDFNVPFLSGREMVYIQEVINSKKFAGDGQFNKKDENLLSDLTGARKTSLTSSGTQALEMAALLLGIERGDEVIMPSFTFSSTANAFLLMGAKIKFIDIKPDTMNMDEDLIEDAITDRTRAIVPVHYAGIACDMDKINKIANNHGIDVFEDAAQCIQSYYRGRALGTLGNLGIYSFHETKNIQCGEGGAIILNDLKYAERSNILMEKGTNRIKFINGEIDHYTWVDVGSSYLMNEISAGFLYAQLQEVRRVTKRRRELWNLCLESLRDIDGVELPFVPRYAEGNGHIFFIKLKDDIVSKQLRLFLKDKGIDARTHFVPLHSSPYGKDKTEFVGHDNYTTNESKRLLRLPMHYYLSDDDVKSVCSKIREFMRDNH